MILFDNSSYYREKRRNHMNNNQRKDEIKVCVCSRYLIMYYKFDMSIKLISIYCCSRLFASSLSVLIIQIDYYKLGQTCLLFQIRFCKSFDAP